MPTVSFKLFFILVLWPRLEHMQTTMCFPVHLHTNTHKAAWWKKRNGHTETQHVVSLHKKPILTLPIPSSDNMLERIPESLLCTCFPYLILWQVFFGKLSIQWQILRWEKQSEQEVGDGKICSPRCSHYYLTLLPNFGK